MTMLALQATRQNPDLCVPNILPCRIHHEGPTKVTKRYWSPATEKDGSKTSHFRGRKLRGRSVKLPSGYQGLVVKSTNTTVSPNPPARPAIVVVSDDEDEEPDLDDQQEAEPVQNLESLSNFQEIVVWGHDQLPDADDTFVKGVEEWIAFAEAIHGRTHTDPGTSIPS